MKNLIIFVVVASVLLISIAIYRSYSSETASENETVGEYIDDSVITTTVKTRLGNDDFFKSFQIGVETRQGIVQLSGFVDSKNAVDKAGEIAVGVRGVRSVQNDLIVK